MHTFRYLLLPILFLMGLCCACHRDPSQSDPTHECVRRMAEQYYGLLINGQYDQYVAAMSQGDSLPDTLRHQLRDAVAQMGAEIQQSRGGIARVQATGDSLWEGHALVFLEVHYADSTTEQIGLPMVLEDCWRIQ